MARFRTAVLGNLYNQDCVNVYHFQGPPGSEDAINSALYAMIDANIRLITSDDFSWVSYTTTDIDNHTQSILPHNVAGLSSGDAPATQTAAVISWKTSYVGRRYRGRNYYAGLTEAQYTNGEIVTSAQTVMSDFAEALINDFPSITGCALMVYSRVLDQMNVVTSYVIRNIPYTIRRRTIGRGS